MNIDSQAPNKVVGEWLAAQGYDLVQPEFETALMQAKAAGVKVLFLLCRVGGTVWKSQSSGKAESSGSLSDSKK